MYACMYICIHAHAYIISMHYTQKSQQNSTFGQTFVVLES